MTYWSNLGTDRTYRFEIRRSVRNEPYWVLIAGNGEIVAVSEMYKSEQACKHSIEAVHANASSAKLPW
ncbi:MAG: YegP family protein [Anaerolineaceae bacterium]